MDELEKLADLLIEECDSLPGSKVRLVIEPYESMFAVFVIDYSQKEGDPQRVLASSVGSQCLQKAIEDVSKQLEWRHKERLKGST
jgi:hypothetical protein